MADCFLRLFTCIKTDPLCEDIGKYMLFKVGLDLFKCT